MLRTFSRLFAGAGLAAALLAGAAAAQDEPAPRRIPPINGARPAGPGPRPAPVEEKEKAKKPEPPAIPPLEGTHAFGATECTRPRTQCVPGVACYAHPSYSCHECGYYVGGGCLCSGGPPQYTRHGT